MNCTILSVGTELLMGQTVNTNATYLSKELNELGFNVLYHFTVGDNPNRLKSLFKHALSISDIIITTGGLGPTQDDLTKEIISESLMKDLYLDDMAHNEIKNFFNKLNKEMTTNNIKQAYLPSGSKILKNDLGTAPGFIIDDIEKIVICLPGPPKEMIHMFSKYVKPYLLNRTDSIIKSKIINFFGIGESALESKLEDLISNQTNPTLATYANDGSLSLRITAKSNSEKDIDSLLNPVIEEVKNRLDKYIYSFNNESLEEVVGNILMENNISISLAESCTGGLLSSMLTSIPGISKVLDRTIVSYSNRAKYEELNVPYEIINKYGAVSKETAMAMAEGLKKITKSDLCISITGIAGPGGGTTEKPVGLVYIGFSYLDNIYYKKFNFNGSREKIRKMTSLHALNLIRKIINNNI